MGIAILKEGFITSGAVTLDVIDKMIANGFKAIFPVDGIGAYTKPTGATAEKFVVILEASAAVDPLNPSVPVQGVPNQPWRVAFHVTDNATMGMFVGSAGALPASGALPFTTASVIETITTTTRIVGVKGIVGSDYTPQKQIPTPSKAYFADPDKFAPHWNQKTEGFINRRTKVWVGSVTSSGSNQSEAPPIFPTDPTKDVSATYPMSYYLAITDRGVFLSIWEGSAANMDGQNFSWVLVQRPVKRDTGLVAIEGKAPVFCVNSVGNEIKRFIVRESDVTDATATISATEDSKDGTAIINDKKQVGVSENNQYIVNYPSRLSTPRYAYTYELDMIGYASATVISATTEIPQTLYGEANPRTYMGLHSNLPANNGMRIVALKLGAGITA